MIARVRGQAAYLSKLMGQLGIWNGLKVRALTWANSRLGTKWLAKLHPPCVNFPVWVRPGSTDPDTYQQIFIHQQYSIVSDFTPEVIVDCGANAGYTSAYFLSRFPTARVIAIEPSPDNAEIGRRNLAAYGERVQLHEAGIWSHACNLVLIAEPGQEWGIQVRAASADEVAITQAIGIRDLKLPRIDLLKIDIEGSEVELFSNGAEAWLPTVRAIVVELHGPECDAAFKAALQDYDYSIRESGELTLVFNITPRQLK